MEIDLMLKIHVVLGTKAAMLPNIYQVHVACKTCIPYVGFESSVSDHLNLVLMDYFIQGEMPGCFVGGANVSLCVGGITICCYVHVCMVLLL